MELYTSYWQNPDLVDQAVAKVGISRGVPRGKQAKNLPYRYKRLPALFPSRNLLKRWNAGTIDPDAYARVYRDYLDSLGPEEMTGQLEKKSAGDGETPLVLLCFCSPGEFCHRRVWADWYRENTGQEVPELPAA
ncbi:MAG: DUF488 domain-containing protein [Actinobacteria bacterium]|nr:DUF488 domain-containing protein [Actinomycetota bacterium]